MQIQATIVLNADEQALLKQVLGSPADLTIPLSQIGNASLTEYVKMFIGQKVFTRGSDMREYRLFLLITTLFENLIPEEQQVSDLFQTKITESRSLIRSVLAKYQYELRGALDKTLVTLLDSVTESDQRNHVTINSEYRLEELNRILASIDGSLPGVKKVRDSVATFEFEDSSLTALRNHFHMDPPEQAS